MFRDVVELAAGTAAFAGTKGCAVLAAVVGTAAGYVGVLTAMPGIVAPVANVGTVPANEPFTGAAALVPLGTAAGLPITATLLPGCATVAADAGMPLFGTVTPLPNTATLLGIVAPADGTVAAADRTVALGTVTPLPNTATLPPAAAPGDATVPFETNAAGKVPLPNGVATVLFGTVTPLPNTATLAAGAVFGTAVATVPDALCAGTVPAAPLATVEGTGVLTGCAELTEDTLPGGNVGLAVDADTEKEAQRDQCRLRRRRYPHTMAEDQRKAVHRRSTMAAPLGLRSDNRLPQMPRGCFTPSFFFPYDLITVEAS